MSYSFVIETRDGSRGEDRASFFLTDGGFVAVVADGAGGTGGGAEAATALCELVAGVVGTPQKSWAEFLLYADNVLSRSASGGLTTAVVVEAVNGNLVGASVGDSGALLFSGDEIVDLTAGQHRKPLLGSGAISAAAFGPVPFNGRLLVASDGVLKYIPLAKICQIVGGEDLQTAGANLIDAAKLPTGQWHDDVAVLLCDPLQQMAQAQLVRSKV